MAEQRGRNVRGNRRGTGGARAKSGESPSPMPLQTAFAVLVEGETTRTRGRCSGVCGSFAGRVGCVQLSIDWPEVCGVRRRAYTVHGEQDRRAIQSLDCALSRVSRSRDALPALDVAAPSVPFGGSALAPRSGDVGRPRSESRMLLRTASIASPVNLGTVDISRHPRHRGQR